MSGLCIDHCAQGRCRHHVVIATADEALTHSLVRDAREVACQMISALGLGADQRPGGKL